jgi:hypothetical protein
LGCDFKTEEASKNAEETQFCSSAFFGSALNSYFRFLSLCLRECRRTKISLVNKRHTVDSESGNPLKYFGDFGV